MDYKVFGCKVNKYYLNKWLEYFSHHPHSHPRECGDLSRKRFLPLQEGQREKQKGQREKQELQKEVQKGQTLYSEGHTTPLIIATCVVTDRAKAKRIKTAKQALKQGKTVYLTGCGAFDRGKKITDEKFYKTYPDLLEYKDKIILLGEEPDSDTTRETKKHQFKTGVNIYTKKFIVIQNGCDSYCTFCLTVQKRGNHKTIPFKNIVEQINDFSDIGGQEVVLTGINLSAWGNTSTNDWQENQFGGMLKKLLVETDIPRIRISSLGPEFLDDSFFEAIEDSRFLPHFHFSIQSFDTEVLKNMRRHYDYNHLKRILNKIRKLKKNLPISIGADIITSFPGETEEQFQTTLQAIQEFQITKLHAFPFSPHRRGDKVPAGFFDHQINDKTKKIRQQQIIKLGDEIRKKFITDNLGTTQKVLLEEEKHGFWQGWTENYISVQIPGEYERGKVVDITLDKNNCSEL